MGIAVSGSASGSNISREEVNLPRRREWAWLVHARDPGPRRVTVQEDPHVGGGGSPTLEGADSILPLTCEQYSQ